MQCAESAFKSKHVVRRCCRLLLANERRVISRSGRFAQPCAHMCARFIQFMNNAHAYSTCACTRGDPFRPTATCVHMRTQVYYHFALSVVTRRISVALHVWCISVRTRSPHKFARCTRTSSPSTSRTIGRCSSILLPHCAHTVAPISAFCRLARALRAL